MTTPFAPQGNAFLTATENLFRARNPQFTEVIKGIPTGKPIKGSDILNQLPGRYIDPGRDASIKGYIADYGKLAGGELGDEPLPSATPTETVGNLAPASEAATPTLAAPAYQYDYGTMAPEQRQSTADTLLKSLGADMSLYDPNVTENVRDKYQDLLANFTTDSGPTTKGWNTNIYNRWGLPDDYYRNFLIPYLTENAPVGAWPYQTKMLINDIGGEYGGAYDQRKALMDLERRNRGSSPFEETMNQVTKFVPGISEARMALEPIASGEHTGIDAMLDISRGLIGGYVDSSGRQVSRDLGRVIPDEYDPYISVLAPIIGAIIKGPAGVIAANDIANEVTGKYERSPMDASTGSAIAGGLSYAGGELWPSSPGVPAKDVAERFAENAWQLGYTPSEAMQLLQDSPGLLQSLSTPLGAAAKGALEYGSPEYTDTLKKLGLSEQQLDALPEMPLGDEMLTPAIESSPSVLDEILRSPAIRKIAEGALKLMAVRGGQQQVQMPYIPPEYAEEATSGYMTPDTTLEMAASPLTYNGGYTFNEMLKEPVAEPSTPFTSAIKKRMNSKALDKALSNLAAMRRAQ